MKKTKADDGAWLAVMYCAVVPAALGIAMAMALGLLSCEHQPSPSWFGMDRASVVCAVGGAAHTYEGDRARCVGGGRLFECVTEDSGRTWQCAETKPAPPAERAP